MDTFALRLGFRLIGGISRVHADRVVAERDVGQFASFEDLARRTRLHRHVLMKLAQGGACTSLGLSRRQALWLALTACEPLPLFDQADEEMPEALPAMSPLQEVLADYSVAGLTLREHPLQFLRPLLDQLGAARAIDLQTLAPGGAVKVAGLVLMRQRPSTAKGVTFVTLEDETGLANLIVWQNVWERYRRVAFTAGILLAHGQLQREAGVIHIVVSQLEDLSPRLADLQSRSRDFR